MKLILTPEDVECAIRNYVKVKVILPDNAKITVTKDNAIIEWTYDNKPPSSSYSGGYVQPNLTSPFGHGNRQTDIHGNTL